AWCFPTPRKRLRSRDGWIIVVARRRDTGMVTIQWRGPVGCAGKIHVVRIGRHIVNRLAHADRGPSGPLCPTPTTAADGRLDQRAAVLYHDAQRTVRDLAGGLLRRRWATTEETVTWIGVLLCV